MVDNGKFNLYREYGLNEAEFNNVLNSSVFNNEQRKMIISIFNEVSGNDEIISKEDWDNFSSKIDVDGNGTVEAKELDKSGVIKDGGLFAKLVTKKNKENLKNTIINFYSMVSKYIEEKQYFKEPEPIDYAQKLQDEASLLGEQWTETDVAEEPSEQKVFYAPPNEYRFDYKPGKKGSFDYNWTLRDAYGSETYEDWLKNNDYEFNAEVGARLYDEAHKRETKSGHCAAQVSDSLSTTPSDSTMLSKKKYVKKSESLASDMEMDWGSAWEYAGELSTNPNFKELPYNIVSTMDLKKLPKGCVIIYDANYKTSSNESDKRKKYHEYGHIAVTDGKGWDSGDGRYAMVTRKQETHIRVFIPIKQAQA